MEGRLTFVVDLKKKTVTKTVKKVILHCIICHLIYNFLTCSAVLFSRRKGDGAALANGMPVKKEDREEGEMVCCISTSAVSLKTVYITCK